MSIEKILFDSKARSEVSCRDLEWYLPLFYFDIKRSELLDFFVQNLKIQANLAQSRLDRIINVYASKSKKSSDIPQELYNLRLGLGDIIRSVEIILQNDEDQIESDFSAASIQREFEDQIDEVLSAKKEFNKLCYEKKPNLDQNCLEIRWHAQKLLIKGIEAQQYERAEIFEGALKTFHEVLEYSKDVSDTLLWLEFGWLYWKRGQLADAERCFFHACLYSTLSNDILNELSIRHLAYIQYLQNNFEGAYSTMQKIFKSKPNISTLFEVARCAVKSGRHTEAENLLKLCIAKRPLTIIKMLADEGFSSVTSLIVSIAIETQRTTRESAFRQLKDWQNMVQNINKVEQMLEIQIEIPKRVNEELNKLFEEIPESHFWQASTINIIAKHKYKEMMEFIIHKIEQRKKILIKNLDKTKKKIEDASTIRDYNIYYAQTKKHNIEQNAQNVLSQSAKGYVQTQEGCMYSIGLSVLGFLLYIIVALILNSAGISIGPKTSTGISALLLVTSPIIIVGLLHVVNGLKYTFLESSLTTRLESAQNIFTKACESAEETYNQTTKVLQNDKSQTEDSLKNVETSLELIRFKDRKSYESFDANDTSKLNSA